MYRASNIRYEPGDRLRGLASGGIGARHQLAQHTGLVATIDPRVQVLKVHLPYHEGIIDADGTLAETSGQRKEDNNRARQASGHRSER